MGSRTAALVAAAFAVALLTGSAIAAGGRTIASAPAMALGQQQLNTLNGIDYWRIPLKEGDRLTLDFGPQRQYAWVEVCLLKPDVSDSTVGNQPCYASQNALDESKLTLDARPAGVWTLAVLPYPGCENGGILDMHCGSSVSYYATAYVKHQTHMTLRAPSIARKGSGLAVNGTITGTRGGVLVEQSWNGGAWSTIGIAHPSANGSFRVRLTPKKKGSLHVRATFPEAPSYIGSSASAFVRVV